jgi:hypothetical protein
VEEMLFGAYQVGRVDQIDFGLWERRPYANVHAIERQYIMLTALSRPQTAL